MREAFCELTFPKFQTLEKLMNKQMIKQTNETNEHKK